MGVNGTPILLSGNQGGSGWPSSRPCRSVELRHRLPAKLLPLVEKYRDKLEKLSAEQGARLTLEKGDDAKELRRALKAAASSLNRRIRFPFRGKDGSLSFYLEGKRGRQSKGEAGAPKRRRRPRRAE